MGLGEEARSEPMGRARDHGIDLSRHTMHHCPRAVFLKQVNGNPVLYS